MVEVRLRQGVTPFHVFVVLAALLLPACVSEAGDGVSTTANTAASTTVSEGLPITEGATTTSPSIATTTTELTLTTTQAVLEVVVEEGQVVSGPDRIAAELGSTVVFVVISDAIDNVHVHGYDLFFDVAPGRPAEIRFTADVPGIFEVELELSHMLLVELEVS